MLRIGDFARMGDVTVKTLRHYDALGLLSPAQVDSSSGYRFYLPEQLGRLSRILALKGMGFSLEAVRDLLDLDPGAEEMRERLLARQRELERSIVFHRDQLAEVELRLRALEERRSWTCAEVLFKRTVPQRVVSLRSRLSSYSEADLLFRDLERRLEPPGRQGSLGAIWHGCEQDRWIDCEAFLPIREGVRAPGGVRLRELGASTVASVLHYGADETCGNAYAAVSQWVATRGRRVSGPAREIYLSPSREKAHAVTEIQIPVE